MKNLKVSLSKTWLVSGATLLLAVGSLSASKWSDHSAVKQLSLSSGASTCFQRVSQTFTALMIGDLSSSYLTKPFMNTTSDCFDYANQTFQSLFSQNFKGGAKSIRAISSDLHWFHEKIEKLTRISKSQGLDLSSSNIINKYSALEGLSSSFNEAIQSSVDDKISFSKKLLGVSAVSLIASILSFCFAIVSGFRRRDLFRRIEKESERSMELNSEFVSANVERALDNILSKINMPKTYSLFSKYHSDLLEKAYRSFEGAEGIDIDKVRSVPDVKIGPTAFYQEALSSALESISKKAFSHGIILETDIEDNFHVRGESEVLEQALCSILNYSADKSLTLVESRKLNLKSKSLGGTAYLRIQIEDYFFNADELDYIEGNRAVDESIDLNLVLVSEMIKDLGAKISLRNKVNNESLSGCEIELLFDRVKDDMIQNSKKVSSIVKGSKREILESISSSI